jgi:hypothetical protein
MSRLFYLTPLATTDQISNSHKKCLLQSSFALEYPGIAQLEEEGTVGQGKSEFLYPDSLAEIAVVTAVSGEKSDDTCPFSD